MRESNRDRILDAVVRLVERAGVTAVTFDAVAAEAGITRAGVIYHFPSREALIFAVHTHLAGQWQAHLQELVPEAGDPVARYGAYVQSSMREASRADLLLMLDSIGDERLAAIWKPLFAAWAPPLPEGDDPLGQARFLARLAADGLWAHQAMGGAPLSPEAKAWISQAILQLLRPPQA